MCSPLLSTEDSINMHGHHWILKFEKLSPEASNKYKGNSKFTSAIYWTCLDLYSQLTLQKIPWIAYNSDVLHFIENSKNTQLMGLKVARNL